MSWDPLPWPRDPRVRRGLALIGGTVKRRRHRHALSQRQLQRLSGLDQGAISRLENGKLNGLRWQRFARIVDALDGLEYAAPPRERAPLPDPLPEADEPDATEPEPDRAQADATEPEHPDATEPEPQPDELDTDVAY